MILFLEKLQINTEYKITFHQKKDTATKRYTLLHAKEILFYKHKNTKHGRCTCDNKII